MGKHKVLHMDEKTPTRSNVVIVVGLVVSILVCFSAGAIGGLATTSSVNGWYAEINKPTWNPPGWIFGPVWSALYLMMGVSAWLVWKDSSTGNSKTALGFFAFHLLLNVLWSIVFFGMRQPGWAVWEIFVLWFSIIITMVLFFRHSKLAAGLLVPYWLWVSFATFLNYTIWTLNRAG